MIATVVVRIPPPTELGLHPIKTSVKKNDQCCDLKITQIVNLQTSITSRNRIKHRSDPFDTSYWNLGINGRFSIEKIKTQPPENKQDNKS